jgi:hypothetical protein
VVSNYDVRHINAEGSGPELRMVLRLADANAEGG